MEKKGTHEGMGDSTVLDKLPERTREVFRVLVSAASASGIIDMTTAEIATLVGISRTNLHTHLVRLRRARLLVDLEAVGVDGGWRRLRQVRPPGFVTGDPPLQTPVTNPHICIYTTMHAVLEPATRVQDTAARRAARPELEVEMSTPEADLAGLFDEHAGTDIKPDLSSLPPYPNTKQAPLVAVPRMPRLTGEINGDAKLLLRAYKAACVHRYGKKPRVDRRAVFRMKAAVFALRRHGVASPYAWANFRLTQWQYSERRDRPPNIDYVFSASVVDEHAAMFATRVESYDVLHRVELTPAQVELLDLWERCRRELVAVQKTSQVGQTAALQVVQSILPPGRYHDLVARAVTERAEIEADLYRRIAAGEWVW